MLYYDFVYIIIIFYTVYSAEQPLIKIVDTCEHVVLPCSLGSTVTIATKTKIKCFFFNRQVIKWTKTKVRRWGPHAWCLWGPRVQPPHGYWVKYRQLHNGIKASSVFPLVVDKLDHGSKPQPLRHEQITEKSHGSRTAEEERALESGPKCARADCTDSWMLKADNTSWHVDSFCPAGREWT